MSFIGKHYFNFLLPLFLAAAWFTRNVPLSDGLPIEAVQSGAIVLIFLITGFLLPLRRFLSGIVDIRLHLWAQSVTFIAFPLLMFTVVHAGAGFLMPEMRQGMLVLGIVPTTASSCVIFTTMAGGNSSGAAFNAVLGNFAGILLSPLLFSLLVAGEAGLEFQWSQIGRLLLIILLPLIIGLFLRTRFTKAAERSGNFLRIVSNLALLLIIYLAVHSALRPQSGIWLWNTRELLVPFAILVGANLFVLAAIWWGSALTGLALADRKALLFVGSQKTVTVGLPLLHAFYHEHPGVMGLVSIPLIIYHPTQLIIAGFVAPRLAGHTENQ